MVRTNLSACAFRVRRPRRQFDRLNTHIVEQVQELSREQRVSIMDQITLALEDSVNRISNVSADLAHPQPVGIGTDTSDINLSRRQLDEE